MSLNTSCFPSYFRYPGYHDNFWPYDFSKQYWEVTATRLAFVFVFQFTVFFITNFIKKLVPDVPNNIAKRIKDEKDLIKSIFKPSKVIQPSSATKSVKGTKVFNHGHVKKKSPRRLRPFSPGTPEQNDRVIRRKCKSNSPKLRYPKIAQPKNKKLRTK